MRRSLWQTRPGHQGIVVTAGEQARIPRVAVLVRGSDGRVTGRAYEKIMGALSMKAFPEQDGRVRLEIIPQIEHGEPRSRFVAADGVIKPDYRPETVLFDDLRLAATLSPGQMLVIGTRADKPGSLGSHFFTEQHPGSRWRKKLFLVRLAAPERTTASARTNCRPSRPKERQRGAASVADGESAKLVLRPMRRGPIRAVRPSRASILVRNVSGVCGHERLAGRARIEILRLVAEFSR